MISIFLIASVIVMSSSIVVISPSAYASDITSATLQDELGGTLYVENANSSDISVIDLKTNALIKNIPVGNSPHDIKISSDQQLLYTTDIDSGTISIINTTTNELAENITTGIATHGIAVFNNTLFYAGDVFGGRILIIKNNTVAGEIKVGSGPEYLELRPDDNKFLYVANLWSPISVVDLAQEKVIKEIDSGATPHGLSFTKDGSMLFIVNMKSDTLTLIDAQNHEIINTLTVGDNPEYVALTPDEQFAYVTNMFSNTVSVIDIGTLESVREIAVGERPHGIAFSPDGNLAYISNMEGNDVSVINTTDYTVIDTISVGKEPHQIVVKKPALEIRTDNSTVTTYVDIADDPGERERGLMFRKQMEWNNGMLFAFDEENVRTFWMKNTYIPLDMIFVNKDHEIIDIQEGVGPCSQINNCPTYSSAKPAQYVLEVNAGFVTKNGIEIGDRLAAAQSNATSQSVDDFDGSEDAIEATRSFLLIKLPEFGIPITDETKLHTEIVTAVTESEHRIAFSLVDINGQAHEGYVETANNEVVHAVVDGKVFVSELY